MRPYEEQTRVHNETRLIGTINKNLVNVFVYVPVADMLIQMGYQRTAIMQSLQKEKFDDIFASNLLLLEKYQETAAPSDANAERWQQANNNNTDGGRFLIFCYFKFLFTLLAS